MDTAKKLSALLLSGSMLLSALPLTVASAEEEPDTMTATITLSGDSASAEGENVTIDGTTVTITASGSYELSGTLDDGQICVNVPDLTADPKTVKLYFNGVTVTGVSDAAVLIENAEKTSINLVAGSENYLYDGETYTNTTAVIYAKDDLTIKGDGKLRIEAAYQQGLHCNNDVKINGGNIKVRTETEDGIRGKTSVEINGGKLDVNAGGDGVKSTKGDVFITGGETEIKAGNDAVQGETSVQISGGSLKANGDRGLTNAGGAVTITGGEILATATDYQPAEIDTEQPVLLLSFAEQQVKDQEIGVMQGDAAYFMMNPDKKFDFVLISSPNLTVGDCYSIWIGDADAKQNGETAFELTDLITVFEDITVEHPDLPAQPNYDISEDGVESVADAVLLSRMVAEDPTVEVTDEAVRRADLNGDGEINAEDLAKILRFLAGMEPAASTSTPAAE